MSAGNFDLNGKYTADNGTTFRCKPQPETSGLTLGLAANAYPSGTVAAGFGTLKLSKGKRELGIVPRSVTVRFTGEPSGQYADYLGIGSSLTLPVFDPDVWDGYGEGQAGSYLGASVVCDRKTAEVRN